MILGPKYILTVSESGPLQIAVERSSQREIGDNPMIESISGWEAEKHDSNEPLSGDEEKSHE